MYITLYVIHTDMLVLACARAKIPAMPDHLDPGSMGFLLRMRSSVNVPIYLLDLLPGSFEMLLNVCSRI